MWSRIYKIFRISKRGAGFTGFSRLARDCSSGSPDPERARGEANPFLARSAGACPPRLPDLREKRTPAKAVSPIEARRGTGPRPTMKGGGLANRSAGACPPRSHPRKTSLQVRRTCMSIVTADPKKLRSFRSLICSTRIVAENIKVLRTLRTWRPARAIDIKVLRTYRRL